MDDRQQIVPGVMVDTQGTVSVDGDTGKLLFDLALELEDTVSRPVDVEHVLAAIVLAARAGQLDANQPLSVQDSGLQVLLHKHMETVFTQYEGRLGKDD